MSTGEKKPSHSSRKNYMREFMRVYRKRPGEEERQTLYNFIYSEIQPFRHWKPVGLLQEPIFYLAPRPPGFPEPDWERLADDEIDEWFGFCVDMDGEIEKMVHDFLDRIYTGPEGRVVEEGLQETFYPEGRVEEKGLQKAFHRKFGDETCTYQGWYAHESKILSGRTQWVGARWEDLRPGRRGGEVKLAVRSTLQEVHDFLHELEQRMKEKYDVRISPGIIFPQLYTPYVPDPPELLWCWDVGEDC